MSSTAQHAQLYAVLRRCSCGAEALLRSCAARALAAPAGAARAAGAQAPAPAPRGRAAGRRARRRRARRRLRTPRTMCNAAGSGSRCAADARSRAAPGLRLASCSRRAPQLEAAHQREVGEVQAMCRRSLAKSSMQGIKPELRLPDCVHAGEVCGRCSRSWAEMGVLERQEGWCRSAVSSSSAASACGDRSAHFVGKRVCAGCRSAACATAGI